MTTAHKLIHHIETLKERHELLDKQIDDMERTGHFGDNDINHLKKERLKLKDEIEVNNKKLDKLI